MLSAGHIVDRLLESGGISDDDATSEFMDWYNDVYTASNRSIIDHYYVVGYGRSYTHLGLCTDDLPVEVLGKSGTLYDLSYNRVEPKYLTLHRQKVNVSDELLEQARSKVLEYVTSRMESAREQLDKTVEKYARAFEFDDGKTVLLPRIHWVVAGCNEPKHGAYLYRAKMYAKLRRTVLGSEGPIPVISSTLLDGKFIDDETALHVAIRYNPHYERPDPYRR